MATVYGRAIKMPAVSIPVELEETIKVTLETTNDLKKIYIKARSIPGVGKVATLFEVNRG